MRLLSKLLLVSSSRDADSRTSGCMPRTWHFDSCVNSYIMKGFIQIRCKIQKLSPVKVLTRKIWFLGGGLKLLGQLNLFIHIRLNGIRQRCDFFCPSKVSQVSSRLSKFRYRIKSLPYPWFESVLLLQTGCIFLNNIHGDSSSEKDGWGFFRKRKKSFGNSCASRKICCRPLLSQKDIWVLLLGIKTK